jgi:hypothetical protein
MSKLPPPDPYEHPFPEPGGAEMAAPLTVLPPGGASAQVERLADAIIAARPGLLIVVARD